MSTIYAVTRNCYNYFYIIMADSILVIDDDKAIANALKVLFAQAGYETEVAYSGQEAIEILKRKKFDLALLDILMPGMHGLEVLPKIKEIS